MVENLLLFQTLHHCHKPEFRKVHHLMYVIGVDFTGEMYVRKGNLGECKVYISLFTSASTRAVLEQCILKWLLICWRKHFCKPFTGLPHIDPYLN